MGTSKEVEDSTSVRLGLAKDTLPQKGCLRNEKLQVCADVREQVQTLR